MAEQREPGLNCPKCGNFIRTTVMELVTSSYLLCPHCHLKLMINKQESKKALEILNKVNDAAQNLEKASHFNR